MQENAREKKQEWKQEQVSRDAVVWHRRIRWGMIELLWGGCAWLLGQTEMLFGSYPLGMALLCADRSHLIPILIGLISSALWQMEEPTLYICTYIALAILRVVAALIFDLPEISELSVKLLRRLRGEELSEERQNETETSARHTSRRGVRYTKLSEVFTVGVGLQTTLAVLGSFTVSLWRIVAGGFHYYDLFAALFAIAVTAAAVPIYSVFLRGEGKQGILIRLSQGALLFSVVWAASELTVFAGFSLSAILALLFSVAVCAKEGFGLGCATAVLCGIAHGPLHAPSFLLAVLLFSCFRSLKRDRVGVGVACFGAAVWSVYVSGAGALITLLPSYLLAGVGITLFLRFEERQEEQPPAADREIRMRMAGDRYEDSNARFRGISDAFSSLSEMFYNLSDRFRRPGTLDLRQICDRSFDAFCPDCPNKSICWGLEYSATLGSVSNLIAALHTKGKVTRAQIPSALARRCESTDAILERINSECAKLTGEMLRNNRTEIFAMDYESAANIINDALEEDDGEYRFDSMLEQRIQEYLGDVGVRAHSVTVYGNRRRQIIVRGVDVELATVTVETMRADLGEMCGLELSHPVFEVEGNVSTMTFRAKKKIAVQSAQNNVSADGGVSGDSINLFSNKKDYFYALINDGMGAGREAALTSNLCSAFLEKMLRAGNRAGTSLRMLNNMIRSGRADSTRECSSTVDLMELDLMTADASFIKSGAAPSFVIRGGVVHRLQSGTAPIGIICALDVQTTPFRLKEGDTVVMISDGILQDDPECEWISGYLATCTGLTPAEIVYHICLHAAECERHDDCSAIAVRITSADES